jgi:plasmid maintenance system antidote protein VapI
VNLQGLTVKQVAERLGLRRHAVLALINTGALKASDVSLKPVGRPTWRVLQSELELFLLRRTRQVAPPRSRSRRRKATGATQYF